MEFLFRSADGTRLVARSWDSPSVRAVVLVVHGFGEYGAKYVPLASELNKHNVAVCAMDLRGFGMSEGRRGHAGALGKLVEDVQAFVRAAGACYEAPLFLMGHSMGAIPVAHAAAQGSSSAGVILSSPWIALRYRPVLPVRGLLALGGVLCPGVRVRFDVQRVETGKKTAVLAAYADKWVHRKISAGLYRSLRRGAAALLRGTVVPSCAILGLHGGQDRLTDPEASRDYVLQAGGRFRFFSEGGHTLHRGAFRKEFCHEIVTWMDDILESGGQFG